MGNNLISRGLRVAGLGLVMLGAAFAHDGMEHVMGTVSAVSPQSVTVQTTDKKTVKVGLTAKTKYTRSDKAAAMADMKVGDRVMIEAKEEKEVLTADTVSLGAAAAPKAKAAKAK